LHFRNVLAAILPAAEPIIAARSVQSLRPTLIDLGPSSLLQTLLSLIAAPTLSRAAQIPAIRAAFRAGRAHYQPPIAVMLRRWAAHGSGGLLSLLWSLSWQLFPAIVGLSHLRGGGQGSYGDGSMKLAKGNPKYHRRQALEDFTPFEGYQPAVQDFRSVGGEMPHRIDSRGGPVTLYCIHQSCCCYRRPAPEYHRTPFAKI
jgi:hypothetical protein